jgi:hypothetical protein
MSTSNVYIYKSSEEIIDEHYIFKHVEIFRNSLRLFVRHCTPYTFIRGYYNTILGVMGRWLTHRNVSRDNGTTEWPTKTSRPRKKSVRDRIYLRIVLFRRRPLSIIDISCSHF